MVLEACAQILARGAALTARLRPEDRLDRRSTVQPSSRFAYYAFSITDDEHLN